jgi:hypothetical protein
MGCRNCNVVRENKKLKGELKQTYETLDAIENDYNSGKTEATEGDLRRLIIKLGSIKESISKC